MKKKFIVLVSLVVVAFSIQAQNWSLIQKDTVQYLRQQSYDFNIVFNLNSNYFGLSLVIDSTVIIGNTTTTYFYRDYSNLTSEFDSCAFESPGIFGDSMILANDTASFFVDSAKSVLWISKSANWTFYSDSSASLQVQLDSAISKGMDSLRFYSFIATAPASHQIQKFDTAKIVISKAYGMIEGFDFSYFPDTLIELQYLRHGQVTNREVTIMRLEMSFIL